MDKYIRSMPFNMMHLCIDSQLTRSFQKQEPAGIYQNKPILKWPYEELLVHQGKLLTLDIVVKSRRQPS